MKVNKELSRGRGDYGWLKANYSFSFSQFFNPNKMGFKSLRVLNEDFIAPGGGFPTHGHQNMEILTIVLSGELGHTDSLGNVKMLTPGKLQRMYAGTGIRHSEFNISKSKELNLIQIWIEPNVQGLPPEYEEKEFDFIKNKEVKLASATGAGETIKMYQEIEVSYLHLDPLKEISFDFNGLYLHVISGEIEINGQKLFYGDSVEFDYAKSLKINALQESKMLIFKF